MAEVPEDVSLIAETIEAHWGSRCPDYDAGCDCCRAWAGFDRLTRQDLDIRRAALEEALEDSTSLLVSYLHFPNELTDQAHQQIDANRRALKEAVHG